MNFHLSDILPAVPAELNIPPKDTDSAISKVNEEILFCGYDNHGFCNPVKTAKNEQYIHISLYSPWLTTNFKPWNMIYIIDTMNVLNRKGYSENKENNLEYFVALFEQAGIAGRNDKVYFILDGFPFRLPKHPANFYFKFSEDREADELIVRKANSLAPNRITVITSDNGIRQRLAGNNISFLDNTFLKPKNNIKMKRGKTGPSEEEKPNESSDLFHTLYKLRMNLED